MTVSIDWPQCLSLVLSGLGATVAIAGTLSMAHSYHVFSQLQFVKYALRNTLRMCTAAGRREAVNDTERLARASEFSPENRARSLRGLILIFVGFCLQIAGIAVALVATVMK